MPMGGIGAGCICLNGFGGLQDFSIRNRPASSAVPDTHGVQDTAFAVLRVGGVARLVEGPMPPEIIYNLGNQCQGMRRGGHEGMPRFAESKFIGSYPFGTVELADPKVPVDVQVTGWSPFIPLDDVNSALPCAILEYSIWNLTDEVQEVEFSFHASHVATENDFQQSRNRPIEGIGVHMYSAGDPKSPRFGGAAIGVVGHHPEIKAAWFRGGWFDSLSALWRELAETEFCENDGTHCDAGLPGRNGGSLLVRLRLEPGEPASIPIVYAWHFPNGPISTTGGGHDEVTKPWRLYYSTQWQNAEEVVRYVAENYASLRDRTAAFANALYSSDIPEAAMDAVSSNLAILKSPTVLRQEDGSMWAWEGCFTDCGCCTGSCTHVWNYAQAIPHLFPRLERSLREQELGYAMDETGHTNFRMSLPMGPASHNYHAASDGQLGGIMKLYRDWQICGDTEWLRGLFPLAKRALDYGIRTWDPDGVGVLMEPHHNTYDIEFWGPDGMCSSIYLGALCAFVEMAKALGEPCDLYEGLARKSADYLDQELFNGEFYIQKVQWEGLRDQTFSEMLQGFRQKEQVSEMEALLLAEGPKYQYGSGCISDGVIGAWMAEIYGVRTPLDKEHVSSHLRAIHRHNFRPNLREHCCVQRPGYANGPEAGLLLCSWPNGGKPTLPFVYSDEVWTGIEYQCASHMISMGLVEEGLEIVAGARSRYDGHTRNSYNEYECGSYYARALASFALLNSLSGFRYSAVTRTLEINPRIEGPFTAFFSAASGFGTFRLEGNRVTLSLVEGGLPVDRLLVDGEIGEFA